MTKYSVEFKEKIILEYLEGGITYRDLGKKYNVNSFSGIREWVTLYKATGIEGLKRRQNTRNCSVQFKLDAIKYKVETGATSLETAIHFGLNHSSVVQKWYRELYQQGVDSLDASSKGSGAMTKKSKKGQQAKTERKTREKQLERENELLRLENSYLKKLKAFREKPNAFHEKHKQSWHSNSKKKDSD